MRKFLNKNFLKNSGNLFIVHDKFTFWEFFKILRRCGYESEAALNFIFESCSLSTLVFQECIYNKKYRKI
ncbi:MAG: hypothetical protein HY813_01875 [Candidatus Portnoybacteria bacterium]|nr:hypothetical protein [Candidatus Portnoybacteria bacterium]